MVLFSLIASSFIIDVYAQTQGGAATSGPATGGAVSGPGSVLGGAGYEWTSYRRGSY